MAQTHNIEITEIAFPTNPPIAKGDTVVWTNRMGMDHTVTADDGECYSGHLNTNQSFSRTFEAAGAVAYHCDIHNFMKGTVTAT